MPQYAALLEQLNQYYLDNGELELDKCGAEEAEHFARRITEQLGVEPPPEYLEFLQNADGFAENGVFLYSVDQEDPDNQGLPGLIAENTAWGVAAGAGKELLFLGHSDLWLYGQSLETKQFHALYKESVQSVKEFADFDDMVTNMLKEALGLSMV